jgi:hypothetical protein
MDGVCSTHDKNKKVIKELGGIPEGKRHLKVLRIYGMIILKCILKK